MLQAEATINLTLASVTLAAGRSPGGFEVQLKDNTSGAVLASMLKTLSELQADPHVLFNDLAYTTTYVAAARRLDDLGNALSNWSTNTFTTPAAPAPAPAPQDVLIPSTVSVSVRVV